MQISKLLSWISDNLPKSQMQEKSYLLRAESSILDKPQLTVHFEMNDVNKQSCKQSSWLRLKMHSSKLSAMFTLAQMSDIDRRE